ncbi:c-di-GMP-binding flagellar brake protein YcgR, contains PilZNR and PilZ domains [Marinospirillum celere]|uniref:C-di-GMP-binding flagellar brake protein YcgR, contains PilZNR and PilZ domains n=1 Tax=Marinospirillum celere TaxID=1122252 RepID=A0A1I1FK60_9GAMM|nr:flagellar brake protein [Marinospirillum celere]SFB98058.1 c-di-GMP-binding flagellar brake protein YcgR, contains PilZNR and PilZ domains [Marinospirillum celere]
MAEGASENLVSNPAEIASLLASLYRKHASITVNFRGKSQHYASMILDLDREEGVFYLDEFNPPSGHKRALSGEPFSIRASTQGLSIFFNHCQLLDIIKEEKGAIYKVAFPKLVKHDQKRQAFRARVLRSMSAPITLLSYERGEPFKGSLVDLSNGGCNFILNELVDPPLRDLEIFEELTLDIEDFERSITVAAEMRRISEDEQKEITSCGVRFINVDGSTQAEIDRLVMFLQREALRMDVSRQ